MLFIAILDSDHTSEVTLIKREGFLVTCKITNKCICCGDCLPECPLGAISEGPEKYEIDPSKCNDCEGYYEEPLCMTVCQEDGAIIQVQSQL